MKNYLIITLLVQLTWFSTDINTLQERGGGYYEINSEEPFSGSVYEEYGSGETAMKGNIENGKKDGLWTEWYRTGQKYSEGTFKDGKEDGIETHWYDNGQKEIETTFKDGIEEGLHTEWWYNGQKKFEETYKNGKKDGLTTMWHENGQKWGKINYKGGKVISSICFDENGDECGPCWIDKFGRRYNFKPCGD
jgi:antitoxin component YwqK of YwqJK toxin-antitoxin module